MALESQAEPSSPGPQAFQGELGQIGVGLPPTHPAPGGQARCRHSPSTGPVWGTKGLWGPYPRQVRDTGDAEWERKWSPTSEPRTEPKGAQLSPHPATQFPQPISRSHHQSPPFAHKQVTGLPLSPHHPPDPVYHPQADHCLSASLCHPRRDKVGPRRRKEFRKKGGVPTSVKLPAPDSAPWSS